MGEWLIGRVSVYAVRPNLKAFLNDANREMLKIFFYDMQSQIFSKISRKNRLCLLACLSCPQTKANYVENFICVRILVRISLSKIC